jgi:hypothetical protein
VRLELTTPRRSRRPRRAHPRAVVARPQPVRVAERPRRNGWSTLARAVRRLLALAVLAAALYGVAEWGLRPVLDRGGDTPSTPTAPAANSGAEQAAARIRALGGFTPGTARTVVHPEIAGLPLSVANASGQPALGLQVEEALRSVGFGAGRVDRLSGHFAKSWLVYAPGWKDRGERAAKLLQVKSRPRGAWLRVLPGRPLVLVLAPSGI